MSIDSDYVYIIQCEGSDCYKIGITNDTEDRLVILQTGCPYRLVLVSFYAVGDVVAVERQLHDILAPFFVRGEWYMLDAGTLRCVEAILTQYMQHWVEVGRAYLELKAHIRQMQGDGKKCKSVLTNRCE